MQISIPCHRCTESKRPLAPCPACGAAPLAEHELRAWRLSLHARHLARITATPVSESLPELADRPATPQHVIVHLGRETDTATGAPATIVPLEPPVPAGDARSFDWEDSAGWLRRSA